MVDYIWHDENYDKRIKLVVDNSKIDGDLENFPVLVHLSNDSGITGVDATCVFDELGEISSNTTHENEDCSDISDWTDNDNDTGVSSQTTFDSKSCFKFDTGLNVGSKAERVKDVGTFGDRVVFEIKLYHPAIGTYVNDAFLLRARRNDVSLSVNFGSDGLFVYNGSSWSEIGVNLVQTGTWQKWIFDCDFSIAASATCDIYFDGVLQASDVDISCTGTFTNGECMLRQAGGTVANRITYVDYVKVGDGLIGGRKKIAITTMVSGVETELYIEIERWDHSNEQACLWTKVPTVVSGTDTELYLYYDKDHVDNTTYVGDTGDSAAQNVWDSNFKGVWHMAQDPNGDPANAIKDSTSNVNHGTPAGSMTSADLVDGKIGKALDFDGENDYINCTNAGVLQLTSNFNVEVVFSPADDTMDDVLGKMDQANSKGWGIRSHEDDTVRLAFKKAVTNYYGCTSSTTLTDGVLYYVSFNYVGDGTIPELFINYTKETTSLWTESGDALNGITDSDEPFDIGRSHIFGGVFKYLKGVIDEVRISNVVRPGVWLKTTYYSNWDDLIIFGAEEDKPVFVFNGYVKVEGDPAARTVHLYRRSNGELVGSTVSNGSTGYFEVVSCFNDYHFVNILPELTDDYNIIVKDKIHPEN